MLALQPQARRRTTPLLALAGVVTIATLASPLAAQPLRVTMDDVVRGAVASSYSLTEAKHQILSAEAEVGRSSAWLASNPFLGVGASASDSEFEVQNNSTNQFRTERFGPAYTFFLQQDFEVAGQRSMRMAAAGHDVDVARSNRRSIEAKVEASAKKAFTAAFEADAKAKLVAQTTQLMEQVNAGFDRDAQGEKLRMGYNSSTIQLLRQRRRQAAANRARDEAFAQLRRTMGLPSEQPLTLAGELEGRPRVLPPLADLSRGLADRRADIAAYRGLLARADARLGLAKRSLLPDVSLYAFISRFDSGDAGDDTSGGGSLGVTLPIFRGNDPSVSEAVGERQRAAAEADDLVLTVEAQLATAYTGCEEAAVELKIVSEEILPRAQENLELQRRRRARGEVTRYDVIDYELELVSAQEELVAAKRAYTDALIDLESAAAVKWLGQETTADAAATEEKPETDQ